MTFSAFMPCRLQASPFFDRLVFNKIKGRLGGRVRIIVTGGAPLAAHTEEFLKVAMCAPVVQGYGLTETCAASCIAWPDQPVSWGALQDASRTAWGLVVWSTASCCLAHQLVRGFLDSELRLVASDSTRGGSPAFWLPLMGRAPWSTCAVICPSAACPEFV